MIQVAGYASSVGSASLNQKLSHDRAANVTTILLQRGRMFRGLRECWLPAQWAKAIKWEMIRRQRGRQRIDALWFVCCKTRASQVTSRANRRSKPHGGVLA